MNRHILGWGLASSAALLLAPRADALPDLVSSDTPPGWSYPALPRSSGDASSGSCALQAPALPGESSNTWFNGSMHNIGTNTANGVYTALYLDDVLKTIQGAYNVLPLGFGLYVNNPSSVTLKGGRHTLLSRADVFGGVSETSELNNDWSRQYIWSPLALTAGAPVTRSGDPTPYSTGSGPYPNCEGFSGGFTAGNWWYAFAVMGTDAGADFDVKLHTETPSNIPQTGFGAHTAWSGFGGDHIDAVIINKNVAPIQTYYGGVSRWAGSGNKVVQFEASPFETYAGDGLYGPYTIGAGDLIDLHEILGYTLSRVSIEIVPVSGTANLGMSLIGQASGGQCTFYDCVTDGWSDSAPAGSSEGIAVTLASTYYGLVVFKHDSSDLSKSCTYSIRISRYPNLVANVAAPEWTGPIVPRNSEDAGLAAVLPPTLNGNQPATSFNYVNYNAGLIATTASSFHSTLFLDDEARVLGYTLDTIDPHQWVGWINSTIGPWWSIVRGGRHYLRSVADIDLSVPEYDETDNQFTDWFVWSPLELANQVPVFRYAPPPAYPTGAGVYPAGDGLRSTFTAGSYWTAVAEMPASMSSEYDMLLHAPSTGSKDGFGESLEWSWDTFPGNPDFCIVNYNVAPVTQYDFSVTNWWGYGDGFYTQEANAPYELYLSPGISHLTGFTLDANDILDMHEFYVDPSLVGQPVLISAKNLYGGVDLELWLFDGAIPYHTKFTAMAGINANGPGGDEQLGPVVFGAAGYYALAVNKSKATDMGSTAWYDLEFVAGPIPNLITSATPPGWSVPTVPRNSTDAAPANCTLPATLTGNAMTTSFNFNSRNSGIGDALPNWATLLSVDDEARWQGNRSTPLAPSEFSLWNNTFQGIPQSLVRGGRHHVRTVGDAYGQVSEISELDNGFTDWFVWTPLDLVNQTPALRLAPPYAYPVGWGPFPSCDGVRTNGSSGYFWTAVGVMPATMGSEYDMSVHTPSVGCRDGFGDGLAYSYDSFPGNPDFCIVNYNIAMRQAYDFSVLNAGNYADGFYVQQADAPYELTVAPGLSRLGPFSLAANDVLDMHEFLVPAAMVGTPVYISVNNLSGGVDLEVWLFGGTAPFHTKFTAMAGINANGPGGDEHLAPLVFSSGGYYALVVNKSKATDMGHAGNYEIVFKTGTSAVDAPVIAALPTEFALSSPRPNPSSSGTSVELAVPAGMGKATVAVYDLAGRRVCTLADGESTPGRHVLKWDGRDTSGLKAAAGVYFVRLETADRKESKKITLLR